MFRAKVVQAVKEGAAISEPPNDQLIVCLSYDLIECRAHRTMNLVEYVTTAQVQPEPSRWCHRPCCFLPYVSKLESKEIKVMYPTLFAPFNACMPLTWVSEVTLLCVHFKDAHGGAGVGASQGGACSLVPLVQPRKLGQLGRSSRLQLAQPRRLRSRLR